MKHMELHAIVTEKSGKLIIEYSDRFYLDKIESFKQANEGEEIRIIFDRKSNLTEDGI